MSATNSWIGYRSGHQRGDQRRTGCSSLTSNCCWLKKIMLRYRVVKVNRLTRQPMMMT